LLFLVPHIIWRLTYYKSGIGSKFMVSRACELQNTKRGKRWLWKIKRPRTEEEQKEEIKEEEKKVELNEDVKKEEEENKIKQQIRIDDFVTDWDKDLKVFVTNFENSLQHCKSYERVNENTCSFINRFFRAKEGNLLTWLYIGTKTLALLLAIVQLFILQTFLDKPTNFYGVKVLAALLNGSDWSSAIGLFPRVTYCDFNVRILGNNNQRLTVQCVLSLNMLNEKIFTMLWFWDCFIIIIISITLVQWLLIIIFKNSNQDFVDNYFEAGSWWLEREGKEKVIQKPDFKKDLPDFVHNYLRKDGVFVMRLVSWNAGVAFTGAFLMYLYVNYRDFNKKLQKKIAKEMKTQRQHEHEDKQMEPLLLTTISK
jgi:hypothetical protein